MRKLFSTFLFSIVLLTAVWAQDRDIALASEYFQNGEYEKAIEMYRDLAKRDKNLPKIHVNYLRSMETLKAYKEAEKYLKKMIKNYPEVKRYPLDYAMLQRKTGDDVGAEETIDQYLEKVKDNNDDLRYTADFLVKNDLYEKAEQAYLLGQKNNKDGFYEELAELYALWGKKDKMVEQYMNMLMASSNDLEKVQIALQDQMDEEEDFDALEPTLVQYVQKNPDKAVFGEMLIWFYLQQNEFYKAFIQARAIDRRKKLEGYKILEIGRMALNNGAYNEAVKIFGYLNERYDNKPVQVISKRLLVKAKEELVKNTFPVEKEAIRSLANDYQEIINEYGIRRVTADAVRSLALLQAFYLNNKDTAVSILESLISSPSVQQYAISLAKLDLGDIYLLKGEPWEASLLYSQVEKAEKDENLGHQAKLKNAKLSYYKGEFELARSHLDILKLATSREIANDAMDLSLLIQDNLDLDTTAATMSRYAEIELLVFQSQYEQALQAYDKMLEEVKGHSLIDEVLWQKSQLLMKLGRFAEAEEPLQQILDEHGSDILADDANFYLGKLYEEHLGQPEKAMEFYKRQLTDFPGSIFNVEARKRFRALRGDNLN